MTKRSRHRKAKAEVPSDDDDSRYWPELNEGETAPPIYKRASEIRDEMKAVLERWPICRAMRERLVFEAFMITQDKSIKTRIRLAAMELLRRMVKDNSDEGGLPHQIEVDDEQEGQEPPDVHVILAEILNDPFLVDAFGYHQAESGPQDKVTTGSCCLSRD